ncbi:MAG TPA: hypothetical protein ENG71_02015 [Thermoplasmatales archaeon]|nr:hypothetical protein [Thermoplasmatales archaeon]
MKKLLILFILFLPVASACKDVIVMNDATAGNYNLFMKVRDPSRPGLQVVFMVDKGYQYSYHHPWKGYNIPYTIKHKLIGVATLGDTPPNIIKAGMLLSDAGIAYGDADSPTYYINPTKYAWDDFDWLRYAAQNASSVEEAVGDLEEVVKMHAPGIGENLFVVGKDKAYVIEADAIHFVKEEVKDLAVMSNYPKQLWHTRVLKRVTIASNFDRVYEGVVRKWQIVRLGGTLGIRILKIGKDFIVVRQFPLGDKVKIEEGKGEKVGYYYVYVEDCDGKTARIKVSYEYYAWENKVLDMLRQKYGKITVMDLMNLSRLHSYDLEGLRGFCEGERKATMIFKIPIDNDLYMAWFAPDQCVSIYVPIHICDSDIYEPYKDGEVAEIAVALLTKFGHGGVNFRNVEKVLIKENEKMEELAIKKGKAPQILTVVDMEMQKQAYLMQKLYLNANENEREILKDIWNESYYKTICNIERKIRSFDEYGKELLAQIALSICKARVEVENIVNGSKLMNDYAYAEKLVNSGKYKDAMEQIRIIFEKTDEKLFGIKHGREKDVKQIVIVSSLILFIAVIAVLLRKPKTK